MRKEFEGASAILIKDPRLTPFRDFLVEVCGQEFEPYFLFLTRDKEECCKSLHLAQNLDMDKCATLYDTTMAYIQRIGNIMLINHRHLINHMGMVIQQISDFCSMPHLHSGELVDMQLYRNRKTLPCQVSDSFEPIERFPERTPLDIAYAIRDVVEGRKLCDVGCGAGDVLEYCRREKICREVVGVEMDASRYVQQREYVRYGNVFDIGLPDADVYYVYVGLPIDRLLQLIKKKSILVCGDGNQAVHDAITSLPGITLVRRGLYDYDETRFIAEGQLDAYVADLAVAEAGRPSPPPGKVQPLWTVSGIRLYAVYSYEPQ